MRGRTLPAWSRLQFEYSQPWSGKQELEGLSFPRRPPGSLKRKPNKIITLQKTKQQFENRSNYHKATRGKKNGTVAQIFKLTYRRRKRKKRKTIKAKEKLIQFALGESCQKGTRSS